MLRRDRQIRMQIQQLLDTLLFTLAFSLAYVLRADPTLRDLLDLNAPSPFGDYVKLFVVLIPAAPMILEAQGFYQRSTLCSRRTTLWLLLKACLFTTLALILAAFLFQYTLGRSVIVWFGFISFALVATKEEIVRLAVQRKVARAKYRRRFVLVGTSEETARMRAELKEQSPDDIEILAQLTLNETSIPRLLELLHEHFVNGVIISAKHSYFEQVEAVLQACELEGVEAWLVADFFKTQIFRSSFDDFYGRPVLVFRTTPEVSWQGVTKQLMDFMGALVVIVLFSWLFVLVGLLIKLTSRGPVLFRQQRSGLNGAPFTIFKFRTMVTNAEQLQHELAAMNEMKGPVFKVTKDPRVTRVGKFLRKYSLDEWPQFFNVLRGEMSLVGPRPLPVDEVKRFNDLAHRRRLSVKPGLTCLWQVSGRNEITDFSDWVRLDLEYIDNWSLWLDCKILCRTVPIVLLGTGAK
jgi:exopolysaccharide biosynthesis polyprenyl glycosylphosphotransferase